MFGWYRDQHGIQLSIHPSIWPSILRHILLFTYLLCLLRFFDHMWWVCRSGWVGMSDAKMRTLAFSFCGYFPIMPFFVERGWGWGGVVTTCACHNFHMLKNIPIIFSSISLITMPMSSSEGNIFRLIRVFTVFVYLSLSEEQVSLISNHVWQNGNIFHMMK